jgi:hypothetical protein
MIEKVCGDNFDNKLDVVMGFDSVRILYIYVGFRHSIYIDERVLKIDVA